MNRTREVVEEKGKEKEKKRSRKAEVTNRKKHLYKLSTPIIHMENRLKLDNGGIDQFPGIRLEEILTTNITNATQ